MIWFSAKYPCNKFLLKKVRHVMLILKKLAKLIKFVFCNPSNSFLDIVILIYFCFFITILVSFYLRRFLLWDSSNLKVTECDFKVVTLLLQGIFIRILILINRPVINLNTLEGGKCAKNNALSWILGALSLIVKLPWVLEIFLESWPSAKLQLTFTKWYL